MPFILSFRVSLTLSKYTLILLMPAQSAFLRNFFPAYDKVILGHSPWLLPDY